MHFAVKGEMLRALLHKVNELSATVKKQERKLDKVGNGLSFAVPVASNGHTNGVAARAHPAGTGRI